MKVTYLGMSEAAKEKWMAGMLAHVKPKPLPRGLTKAYREKAHAEDIAKRKEELKHRLEQLDMARTVYGIRFLKGKPTEVPEGEPVYDKLMTMCKKKNPYFEIAKEEAEAPAPKPKPKPFTKKAS